VDQLAVQILRVLLIRDLSYLLLTWCWRHLFYCVCRA
jgi:hypothetical protein